MATLVTVLVLCLAGITAVSMQLRCIDAAREAARLAARGDERSAVAAARGVAPGGAAIDVRRDGDFVIATVTRPVVSASNAAHRCIWGLVVEPTR